MRLREWLMYGGAAILIVLTGLWLVVRASTERAREHAVTALKKPASLVRHEQWMQERDAERKSAPASVAKGEEKAAASGTMGVAARCAEYGRVLGLVDQVLSQLSSEYKYMHFHPAGEWSDELKAAVLQLIKENPTMLDEVRMLAGLEGPVTDTDYSKGTLRQDSTHLMRIQESAMLLCCAAEAEIKKGDVERGVHDLIAVAKLADTAAADPAWTAYYTQRRLIEDISDVVQENLASGDASPALLQDLLTHLDDAYHREALANSVSGFEYATEGTFEDLRSMPIAEFSKKYDVDNTAGKLAVWAGKTSLVRPLLDANEAMCADVAARVAGLSDKPPYESAQEFGRLVRECDHGSLFTTFARTKVTPVFLGSLSEQAEHEATVDMTRIGVALEIYHAQNGTYPDSLDAIAGRLGGSVPLDAFTGTPYVYEPRGDSFYLRTEKPATGLLQGKDVLTWRGGR